MSTGKRDIVLTRYKHLWVLDGEFSFIVNGKEWSKVVKQHEIDHQTCVGCVKLLKEVALLDPTLRGYEIARIKAVGLRGLRDFFTISIADELMVEIKDGLQFFPVSLLQVIDAINGNTVVSDKTGKDISYKEPEQYTAADSEYDWLTADVFASMLK